MPYFISIKKSGNWGRRKKDVLIHVSEYCRTFLVGETRYLRVYMTKFHQHSTNYCSNENVYGHRKGKATKTLHNSSLPDLNMIFASGWPELHCLVITWPDFGLAILCFWRCLSKVLPFLFLSDIIVIPFRVYLFLLFLFLSPGLPIQVIEMVALWLVSFLALCVLWYIDYVHQRSCSALFRYRYRSVLLSSCLRYMNVLAIRICPIFSAL